MKERIGKMKNSKKKGFTLIELVVVIAILAILALIMVPNLTAYLGRAKEAKIQANMKNVHTASEMIRQTEGSLDEDRIKEFSNNQDVKVDENATEEDLDTDKYTVTNKGGQTVVKYKTKDGKVFTFPDVSNINNGGSGESEDPDYGNEYLATDSDFEWVGDDWGYTATDKEGKGYYKYKGEAEIVKIPHVINGNPMTSYYMMFYENTKVEKVISDNSNITDMSYMFYYSEATTLDLSSFDTSKVTNMFRMFYESQATTLDLSNFDTSNVTNMSQMFSGSKATSLDLSNFDTSKVEDMSWMFYDSHATSLDLSSFDTSNVTDMNNMFADSKATTLDLSSFNTSNVTHMGSMFNNSQATSLDLSNFNTSKVTKMFYMFKESQATIITGLNKFDTSNVTDMCGMFDGSQATELDLSSFDTSKVTVTNMRYMFYDSQATTGYARTQEDADRFNNEETDRPAGLNFVVK